MVVQPITQFGETAGTLTARYDSSPCADRGMNVLAQPISIHPHCIGRKPESGPQGKEYLLDGSAYCMDSRGQPQAVAQPIAFQQTADCLTAAYGTKWNGNASATNGSLFAAQPMPINTMVALRHEALGEGTGFGIGAAGDPAYTLTKGHSHAVAQPFQIGPQSGEFTDVAPTLDCRAKNGPIQNQLGAGVLTAMQVRRLTPVECERLQGFPDGYTAIHWRKKPVSECPDGPRYKALGNSWAVPNVRWIGKRIQEQICNA